MRCWKQVLLIKKVTSLNSILRDQTSEKVKIIKDIHETQNIGLNVLFKVANITKSVYYYWVGRFKEPNKDETIIQAIKK